MKSLSIAAFFIINSVNAQVADSFVSKAYKKVYEAAHKAFDQQHDTITEQTAFLVLQLKQSKVDSIQVWSVNDQYIKNKLKYIVDTLMNLIFDLPTVDFIMVPVRITDARIERTVRADEMFFDSFTRAFKTRAVKNVILLRAIILDILPVIYDKSERPTTIKVQ